MTNGLKRTAKDEGSVRQGVTWAKSQRATLAHVVLFTFNLAIYTISLESAHAHPFHISHGQAEWNADTSRLEVAISLNPDDLEAAVQAHGNTARRLDDQEIEPHVQSYVLRNFVVTTDQGPAKVDWVGFEVNAKEAWTYFEIRLTKPPSSAADISHRLLLNSVPHQVNYLTVQANGAAETYRFSADSDAQRSP